MVQARWETDTWQVDRGWMVQSQMKGLDLTLWALDATGRYQMENGEIKFVLYKNPPTAEASVALGAGKGHQVRDGEGPQ